MPREVRLLRRVLAGGAGWAGDSPSAWSQATPPAAAVAPHTELTSPILTLPIYVRENPALLTRGVVGILRVTGADSTRRFTAKLHIEWLRIEAGVKSSDWRVPTGHEGIELGDGDDFTSDPIDLRDSKIAIHLTPIGGSLAAGSTVELWTSEV